MQDNGHLVIMRRRYCLTSSATSQHLLVQWCLLLGCWVLDGGGCDCSCRAKASNSLSDEVLCLGGDQSLAETHRRNWQRIGTSMELTRSWGRLMICSCFA